MKKVIFPLAITLLMAGCSSQEKLPAQKTQDPVTLPPVSAVVKKETKTVVEVYLPPVETVFSTEDNATEMVQTWLSNQQWSEGYNTTADGRPFIVVTGYGVASAPIDSTQYVDARMAAFDKAMLDAKTRMIGYLSEVIARGAAQQSAMAISEGEDTNALVKDALHRLSEGTLLEKQIDAVTASLVDNAKTNHDTTPSNDVLMSKTFQQSITQAATGAVSGMQAFYTVESHAKDDTNTEIGVVAVWSPTLAKMATAIMRDDVTFTTRKAKKTIREQIPEKDKLLSTFGVQQYVDERGDLVLVSYAQAGSIARNKTAERAAYDKAQLHAKAQLRAFASEVVASSAATARAEFEVIYKDDPDNAVMAAREAFQQMQQSTAEALTLKGILQAKTWSATHPVSGKKVFGSVCTWSPKQEAFAKTAQATIQALKTAPKKNLTPAKPYQQGGQPASKQAL